MDPKLLEMFQGLMPEQKVEAIRAALGDDLADAARRKLMPVADPPILTPEDFKAILAEQGGHRNDFTAYGYRFRDRRGRVSVVITERMYDKMTPGEVDHALLWSADERFPGDEGAGDFGFRVFGYRWYLAMEETLPERILRMAYEEYDPALYERLRETIEQRRKREEEAERKWMRVPTPEAPWVVTRDEPNGYSHCHLKPPGLPLQSYRSLSEKRPKVAEFHFRIARLFNSMVEWFGVNSPDPKVAKEWKHTMDTYNGVWNNYADCDELRDVIRWYRTDFTGMFKEFIRRRGAGKITARLKAGEPGLRILAAAAVKGGVPRDQARKVLQVMAENPYDMKDEWLTRAIDASPEVAPSLASIFARTYADGPITPVDKYTLMLADAERAIAATRPLELDPELTDDSAMPENWRRIVGARKAAAARKVKRKAREGGAEVLRAEAP